MASNWDKGSQRAIDELNKKGKTSSYKNNSNKKSNKGQYKEDGHVIGWILILFFVALWFMNRFFQQEGRKNVTVFNNGYIMNEASVGGD